MASLGSRTGVCVFCGEKDPAPKTGRSKPRATGGHFALQDPVGGDASVCQGSRCWANLKKEGGSSDLQLGKTPSARSRHVAPKSSGEKSGRAACWHSGEDAYDDGSKGDD